MTRSVRSIIPEVTACEVATLFAEHNIGSVVVVDPETGNPDDEMLQDHQLGSDIALFDTADKVTRGEFNLEAEQEFNTT